MEPEVDVRRGQTKGEGGAWLNTERTGTDVPGSQADGRISLMGQMTGQARLCEQGGPEGVGQGKYRATVRMGMSHCLRLQTQGAGGCARPGFATGCAGQGEV